MRALDLWLFIMIPGSLGLLMIDPLVGGVGLAITVFGPILATVLSADPETHYRDQHLAEVAARKARQNETPA